jgi:hypothetical protein
MDMSKRWRRGDYQKKYWNGMATIREKETRQTQTYLGGGD